MSNTMFDAREALAPGSAFSRSQPPPNAGEWLTQPINGLVQERRNSSALAVELRLSCTKPLLCGWWNVLD